MISAHLAASLDRVAFTFEQEAISQGFAATMEDHLRLREAFLVRQKEQVENKRRGLDVSNEIKLRHHYSDVTLAPLQARWLSIDLRSAVGMRRWCNMLS
ncbi:MAG: hypothetical protein QM744_10460 [Mesorhizobium sp.]